MMVCHLCTTTFDTSYFKNLWFGLSARGIRSLYVSLSEYSLPHWAQEIGGIDYAYLDAASRKKYPRAILKLAWLLRKRRVKVLQTHLYDAGIVGILAARMANVPVVIVTRHHLDEPQLLGGKLHVALDRWMATQADCVIVPSIAVRQHMIKSERVQEKKIEVVHYGFDFSSFRNGPEDRWRVREELGLQDDFVVGCVGRLFKNKGQIYLIAPLKHLVQRIPNIKLLLLGDGDKSAIEAAAHNLGVQDRVIFAGYRRDIFSCMAAMDLLVHPSLSESFGQVLVEAMAVGTPVIATRVGGILEIVKHGETGWLIPPADEQAVLQAILYLYDNPAVRKQMAENAQKNVRALFPVEKMVDKYVNCYKKCLSKVSKVSRRYC